MFRPHQKWTITAVPDGGGYLGGPYYKIVIEGTQSRTGRHGRCGSRDSA